MALQHINCTADLSSCSTVYFDSILCFDFQGLDQEEGQYVLNVAKLVLRHARHLQWIIDTCQIDESQFVAMYRSKDDEIAQLFVKAMIASYMEIYENLANRMSFVLRTVPSQLIQLRDWLSSQSYLTNQRKLRHSCAHEANIVPPLHGTTEETWSVFNPQVFFESVQASMPPLIMELVLLVANLEPALVNLRTPSRTPPDNTHVVNQQLAELLLEEESSDPQFQDLNTRLTRLRKSCAVFDIMLQKIQSGFFNLRQRQAFKWATVFKIFVTRFEDQISTVQQARNERAAEIVEARSEGGTQRRPIDELGSSTSGLRLGRIASYR